MTFEGAGHMRGWPGRGAVVLVAVALVATGAAGCAKAAARTAPAEPPAPLEVPVPPPRVLAPVSEADAPPNPPEVPEAPARPTRPRPTPRPPGGTPDRGADPARSDPGPPEATPAVPAEANPPALRTPQTANDAEAERRVQEVLARATRDLDGISRPALSADARAQYDTARRFIDQAQGALTARNYMFAAYLADKAEALARGLSGR